MKAGTNPENNRPQTEIYKKRMIDIEFMEEYIEDPDIFIPDSAKFNNFLIHSFCFLYSDFHYLSFLRKEEVDLEIIKVSGILQILPRDTKKITKLFDNMTKDEIHRFWLKFFSLFKKKKDFSTDSIFNNSWKNKINFFKNMPSTLDYLNYEFPVVNVNKLNCADINAELESWKEQLVGTVINPDESPSFNNVEEQIFEVDIDKLTVDLRQVLSMYRRQEPFKEQNKSEHVEFFINFINLTKSILQYKKNFDIVNSTFLDEFNIKMFATDENLLDNLYFIKRCNNLVKMLKSKLQKLY